MALQNPPLKRTRVEVSDDKEVVIVTEQQCDAYLDACHAQRTMRQQMQGKGRWLKIADIPPVMYQREIAGPAKGQEDLIEAYTWRFLRDNPRFMTTEKRVSKPKRMV